ncbi:Uncharacterised protein [Mycobacterium tuberculosis]|nr:Uncharacterised protein [Mycobacterium tuberculosis]
MAPEGMLAAGSVPVLAELLRLFNEISAPLRTSLTGPENPSTRTRELVVGGDSFYSNRLGWYRRRQSRTHVRGQKPLIRQINHNRRDPAPGQLATHSVAW